MSFTFFLIFSVLTFLVAFIASMGRKSKEELNDVVMTSITITGLADCILLVTHCVDWLL